MLAGCHRSFPRMTSALPNRYSCIGVRRFLASLPVRTSSPPLRCESIQERMEAVVPLKKIELNELKVSFGDRTLGKVSVKQVIGGMRGIPGLLTETSLLDPEHGIRFRGLSIPEVAESLPKLKGTEQPMAEGMFWFLLTGELPTLSQAKSLTEEFHKRSALPKHVVELLERYPKSMHPMTQLSSAVLALQTESKFNEAYAKGVKRSEYWKFYLEDAMDLIAKLPEVAARIYHNSFREGSSMPSYDHSQDWAANFSNMLGFNDPTMLELMRMYCYIHSDHEGGNVSAHATHLVGSALSDVYLSFSAGLNGLAGPLHGLANQEVLRWTLKLQEELGEGQHDKEKIREAVWATLNSGQVIPGFGHAVLRKTDPRYISQRLFALKYLPEDPLFKLISVLYEVVPVILKEHGKTKNPWPNVDAHSGVLLSHFGLTESRFYTVLFGVSRSLGVLASLVNDRALGLPIERPKSTTMEEIRNHFQ